jgi:hypothetical protein
VATRCAEFARIHTFKQKIWRPIPSFVDPYCSHFAGELGFLTGCLKTMRADATHFRAALRTALSDRNDGSAEFLNSL